MFWSLQEIAFKDFLRIASSCNSCSLVCMYTKSYRAWWCLSVSGRPVFLRWLQITIKVMVSASDQTPFRVSPPSFRNLLVLGRWYDFFLGDRVFFVFTSTVSSIVSFLLPQFQQLQRLVQPPFLKHRHFVRRCPSTSMQCNCFLSLEFTPHLHDILLLVPCCG